MTFVSCYNIKLNIIKAIGINSGNKNINNLCNILSCKINGDEVYQDGRLILLKIKTKNENIKND